MQKLFFLPLVTVLSSCTLLNDSVPKAEYLTILHTNDNHGRFWQNDKGEYGMSARKTLIDRLRTMARDKGHAV